MAFHELALRGIREKDGSLAKSVKNERIFKGLFRLMMNCDVLEMNKLFGIGFAGGSSMSGLYKCAQAEVRKRYPLTIYTHCLNLTLVKASRLDLVQMLYGYL